MKRIGIIILISGGIAFACDVADDGKRNSMRDAEFAPDELPADGGDLRTDELDGEDNADDEESVIAAGQNPSTTDPETQPAPDVIPGSNDLAAEIDPQYTSPTCEGIGFTGFNAFYCNWERGDATTGFFAQQYCDTNEYPISGTCYGADDSHKLVSTFAVEANLDVVDDEQGVGAGLGWACQWDTAATSSANKHIVAVLCCPTISVAHCA